MQRLNDRSIVPPDPMYFRFVHKETGHVSQAHQYQPWIDAAHTHITSNGLEMPSNLESVMEDQLCSVLPPGWCKGVDPNAPVVEMRFPMREVRAWAEAQLRAAVSGLVDQAEAERRAKICAGCPFNIRAQGCIGCQHVAELFTKTLGGRSTSADPFLKSCATCKCFLPALVWYPQEIIDKVHAGIKNDSFPKFCWQRRDSENYVPS